MKTPRDILFAKHHAAEPKLDEVREFVVTGVCDCRRASEEISTAVTGRRYSTMAFLREVFSFRPTAWAGLAALWLVILALKLSTHDATQVVARKTSLTSQAIAEVRQRKLLFAELAGLQETKDAGPPKVLFIRPRSDLRNETFAV